LLSFEVDIWGRQRRATEAARADLLGAEETRKAVMTTVVGDVSAAYFNLLELDTELEIAKDTLNTRQESLNLVRTRQQGGVADNARRATSRATGLRRGQIVPDIERLNRTDENRINLLQGKDPVPWRAGVRWTEQEQPPAAPAGLPSSLLARRPDIRASEATLRPRPPTSAWRRPRTFLRFSLTGFMGGKAASSPISSAPRRRMEFRAPGDAADL